MTQVVEMPEWQAIEEIQKIRGEGTVTGEEVTGFILGACHYRAALLADRDLLAAELARVRRNHLRRMERRAEELAGPWRSIFAGIPEEHCSPKAWRYRWLQRVEKVRDACRAALAQLQDGTTEGQA